MKPNLRISCAVEILQLDPMTISLLQTKAVIFGFEAQFIEALVNVTYVVCWKAAVSYPTSPPSHEVKKVVVEALNLHLHKLQ